MSEEVWPETWIPSVSEPIPPTRVTQTVPSAAMIHIHGSRPTACQRWVFILQPTVFQVTDQTLDYWKSPRAIKNTTSFKGVQARTTRTASSPIYWTVTRSTYGSESWCWNPTATRAQWTLAGFSLASAEASVNQPRHLGKSVHWGPCRANSFASGSLKWGKVSPKEADATPSCKMMACHGQARCSGTYHFHLASRTFGVQ